MPPISSGSEVVGAATDAPVGAKIINFSASALRTTASRHGPSYVRADDQLFQNRSVETRRDSTALLAETTIGSPHVAASTTIARLPASMVKEAPTAPSCHDGDPASHDISATV